MSLLEVVIYPHPSLTTAAKPVVHFDQKLHALLDDMAETMYTSQGVGLAANQVDVLKQILVIDFGTEKEERKLFELINPTIVEKDGKIIYEEGCLSFPDLFDKISRSRSITIQYQDRFGGKKELKAEDLFAVVLQHEIDHLDGIVFIDKMNRVVRRLAMRRFRKIMAKRAKSK